jgi:hypothetical protein
MDVADLFVALKISNQTMTGSIIVSARRGEEIEFCLVSLLLMDPQDPQKP